MFAQTLIPAFLLLVAGGTMVGGAGVCEKLAVSFIMTEGDATLEAIEDDIRRDLEKLDITVTKKVLPKDDFNKAMVAGEFNLAFSETWGPPYDPHSYASSWNTPDEAYYAALKGLPAPNTQEVLAKKIDDVLKIESEKEREDAWAEILSVLHTTATELPMFGKRIPAVANSRLGGYRNGLQQFDYPVHTVRVMSGSKNITVAPGGQTGLFVGVGRLDPHSYRPNEFFANNWVYDGLVEYGPEGTILPSLAMSWTVQDISGGGQIYTFTLREGVNFHDGAAWDCDVAKLNFDHVLAPPLTTGDYHGWYALMSQIDGWKCKGKYVFEVTTKDKYYPLLQELTYIRPLRMLSPKKFVGGATSDPLTQNSCPTGWGTIAPPPSDGPLGASVTCAGTLGISGTGRWKYVETDKDGEDVRSVLFQRNPDHWDNAGSDVVEYMRLVRYKTKDDVKAALLDGTLDMVVGDGVLAPSVIEEFRTKHISRFRTSLTETLQNRIIIFNTAKAPTDDFQVRKILIHAVNKPEIVKKEIGILGSPAHGLFPKTAPYCNVDLTPTWDYDFEKAQLLNRYGRTGIADCNPPETKALPKSEISGGSLARFCWTSSVLMLTVAAFL